MAGQARDVAGREGPAVFTGMIAKADANNDRPNKTAILFVFAN